jgi:hypothetical protein
MNDSVVVFERIDLATLLASAGSDAGYPLTNLQDGRYATQWKSGATTQNQTLKITHAASLSPDYILIVNHNLNSLGLTGLEIQDDAAGVVKDITSFPSVIYEALTVHATTFNLLKFKKGSALSAAPLIGMIFIGTKVSLPLYLNNPKRGLKADLIRDESLSGLRFVSSSNGIRQTWKLDWGALKQASNAEVFRWISGVGVGLHPFWIKDMDDHWHFVRNDFDAIDGGSKGNVAFDFKNVQMSEERVGSAIELPGNYTV